MTRDELIEKLMKYDNLKIVIDSDDINYDFKYWDAYSVREVDVAYLCENCEIADSKCKHYDDGELSGCEQKCIALSIS